MSEDPKPPSGQKGPFLKIGKWTIDPSTRDFDPEMTNAILVAAIDELVLLRKICKEVIRREGRRIVDAGDYYRSTVSFANKIGASAEDVNRILEPILREVFEEMFAKRESNRTQQRRR